MLYPEVYRKCTLDVAASHGQDLTSAGNWTLGSTGGVVDVTVEDIRHLDERRISAPADWDWFDPTRS
jgi:hypothetical protein